MCKEHISPPPGLKIYLIWGHSVGMSHNSCDDKYLKVTAFCAFMSSFKDWHIPILYRYDLIKKPSPKQKYSFAVFEV